MEGARGAGPEDPLRKGVPAALPAGSCFPGEEALEAAGTAGLSRAASFPAGTCSEAGLASTLGQHGGEEERRRGKEGEEKRFGREGAKVRKEKKTRQSSLLLGSLT